MRYVWRGGTRSQSCCQHVWMHTVKFKSSHTVPIQIQFTKQAREIQLVLYLKKETYSIKSYHLNHCLKISFAIVVGFLGHFH